ncbi:MAG TPA: YdbH domain-containing protein [Dongiaceae bacterium]|nr:YdbH domain-containing protein [Dongiaceae bacterium]
MRRRTAALLGLIGLPVMLLMAAGAAIFWRKPLAETAISAYVARAYGVPVTIAIGDLGTRTARIEHVKIGRDAPFEADDIRLDYDLDGHVVAISVGSMSAHGRIEGGTVTLGDLQPLLEGSGDTSRKSEARLPETISIDRLHLALETPMGGVAIGGSARLGKGALALDLAATDPGGHTRGTAKIDVSSALDHPTMTGDVRITLAPQSPLWALAPAIAPQEGTVEASLHLDHVEAALDPIPGGKPVAVALRLDQMRNPLLSAPLSGTLTADVRSTHLPLAIENISLDLSGGLSPKTKVSASGSATLALSARKLALDLTARIAASDDSFAVAGWQIRAPQIAVPIHLTFIDGVLAAALSDDGTIAHKGLTDATKGTSIGAGTLTLQHDSTAFRLNTSDGTWNARAVTAPIAFSAKSLGETVDLSAPAVTVSASSDETGTRWHVDAAKIAFQNKVRGVSASNALIKLSGEGSGVAGEIRISKFDAGYGLPTITLNGDGQLNAGKLTAQLNAITGAGGGVNLGKITLTGNLNAQRYDASLDLGPIVFTPKGLQPAHLFPAAKSTLRDFSGSVRLAGPISWVKGKANSDLKLGLAGLTGQAGPVLFQNLNGVIEIDQPWPVSTRPDQQLAIEQLIAGLPMTNALVRFELDGPRLKIAEGHLDMAGGHAGIAPTDILLNVAGQRMTLNIDQLSVSELFKIAGVPGLSGEGAISGAAPITLFPNGIIVDNAKFAANAPGVLRYDAKQAPAALSTAGSSVGMALQALSDFHYKELVVTLDRKLTGDTTLGLHISGSNPSFYNGYPVEFNLNLSGKLDEVLRKGLAGYRLPSIIEERLNDLQ